MQNRTAQVLSTYIMIVFGISIVFFLAGYKPIIFTTFETQVGSNQSLAQTLTNNMASIFTNPLFLLLIGFATVTPLLLAGGGGNFTAAFIVPLFFLSVFLNLFLLPSAFIFDQSLPVFLRILFGVGMNLLLAIGIMNFARGGSA